MTKNNKIYSFLGLAAKAGKVGSGEFVSETSIKKHMACLVIVAEDASENTKKHFRDMCSYRNIPIRIWGTKDELGHSIGKEMRVTIVINDSGFAESLIKQLDLLDNIKASNSQEEIN